MPKKREPIVNERSERIVVDEIFDDGMARLLRVAAFVGYPSKLQLKEGDVFVIADGTKLNMSYKPIPRERASLEHLLIHSDTSREIARREIKKQFYKLTAAQVSTGERERNILIDKVDKKFKDDSSTGE